MVIDLYHKYKTDIFFSTRVKIIFFHTLWVIVIVIVMAVLLEYVGRQVEASLIKTVYDALATGDNSLAAVKETDEKITYAQTVVYSVIVLISLFGGLVITRLALKPVKNSLIVQRRFIASVAHELRTPLAVLKTQNEVAKLDVDPFAPVAETLEQNVEEIDHITEILNSLLLFNRVDTLESITFEAVDLTSVIEIMISRLKKFAEKKGVRITFEQSVIPHVYGNKTGLEQLFFNIIKNGINYTKSGGEVVVKCTTITEHDVTMRVSDNGIGIPKDELSHVFEPFYRASGAEGSTRGTGLGLALVFEIIKLHQGKIYVESTPQVGTQFNISIPRKSRVLGVGSHSHKEGIGYDFSEIKASN